MSTHTHTQSHTYTYTHTHNEQTHVCRLTHTCSKSVPRTRVHRPASAFPASRRGAALWGRAPCALCHVPCAMCMAVPCAMCRVCGGAVCRVLCAVCVAALCAVCRVPGAVVAQDALQRCRRRVRPTSSLCVAPARTLDAWTCWLGPVPALWGAAGDPGSPVQAHAIHRAGPSGRTGERGRALPHVYEAGIRSPGVFYLVQIPLGLHCCWKNKIVIASESPLLVHLSPSHPALACDVLEGRKHSAIILAHARHSPRAM